jgi:hypothetical protein
MHSLQDHFNLNDGRISFIFSVKQEMALAKLMNDGQYTCTPSPTVPPLIVSTPPSPFNNESLRHFNQCLYRTRQGDSQLAIRQIVQRFERKEFFPSLKAINDKYLMIQLAKLIGWNDCDETLSIEEIGNLIVNKIFIY